MIAIHSIEKIVYSTGGPRYMQEIGAPKIGSNIMNSHIKRPRITINRYQKKGHFSIAYTQNRR